MLQVDFTGSKTISTQSFIKSSLTLKEVPAIETSLRPKEFKEFVGQPELCQRLKILMGAAKSRKEVLGHLLFSGPPGLGKTTLAHIVANEMGGDLIVTSGAVLEKAKDLAGVLTSLKEGSVLFIDEIHRLNRAVEEYLYPAMEDFCLDLMIDSGPAARSVQVKLPNFTLIGATTRSGLITAPLRSRFSFSGRLDYYPEDLLSEVIARSAGYIQIELEQAAAQEIAKRSRGTPRVANHLLRWVRDFAHSHGKTSVDEDLVVHAMELLAIDTRGLDEMDNKLLEILISHYNGGPVGLNTLAIALGEESHTIEEVHEPYLVMQGMIKRTPKGRQATALAYEHIRKMR